MTVTVENVNIVWSVSSATGNRATRLGDGRYVLASLCLVLASPIRQWWASAAYKGEGKGKDIYIIYYTRYTYIGCFLFVFWIKVLLFLLGET